MSNRSELIFITTPSTIKVGGGPSGDVDMVVGIRASDRNASSVMKRNYEVSGRESEEAVRLPKPQIKKITDFFMWVYSEQQNNNDPYNCHTFARWVTSDDTYRWRFNPPASRALSAAHQPDLQAGVPYGVGNSDSDRNHLEHSIVGTDKPKRSISVAGGNGNIVIADNDQIMLPFNADRIVPITLDYPEEIRFAAEAISLARRLVS